MVPTAETYLAEIVQVATIELFSDHGARIGPTIPDGVTEAVALCGVIGFTGPDMRGTLMLACSARSLELTSSEAGVSMRDWLAELTNQLLGRVKNKIVAMGAKLHVSIPVVIGGERIAPIARQPLGHLFTADGGVVSVWFDTELRDDLELVPDTTVVAAEGSVLF